MRVSVFGLGYVGCVTAGCLARDGHEVTGVDVNAAKVGRLAGGLPTVVETDLDDLIAAGHRAGRIRATTDSEAAVRSTDASIICVGTPNGPTGNLDLTAVRQTAEAIGAALVGRPGRHLVVNRSTVPAGTAEGVVLPALLAAGTAADRVGLAVVPEFLREGSAIADYYDPPFVVVGTPGADPGPFAAEIDALFGQVVRGRIRHLGCREAEMMKALCNVFHALKVSFANEVGALCSSLSLDGRAIMRELVADTKLNISPAYLRPGMPFGGSCLPKDLRMVLSLAHDARLELPLLRGVLASNETQIARGVAAVKAAGKRRIGLDGLSFKAGTDDLRESPQASLAEQLIGSGYDLKIYDPDVQVSRLTGANQKFIEERLPHLSSRLVSTPEDLLRHAELVVLTRDHSAVRDLVESGDHPVDVVDLTGKTGPGRGHPSSKHLAAAPAVS